MANDYPRKKNKQADGKPAQVNDNTTVDVVRQIDWMDEYTDDVDPKYVPEGFDSVDDYLQDMREEYTYDWDYDYENREDAIEDKKFAAGEQWDPIVLQLRVGLPCLTINSIPQFTAQVVGDWRQNRNAIEIVPNDDGNEDTAQVRGDLIRSIEMHSRASRVYDQAFESCVQCGDGAFRVAVEYAKDSVFDQDIYIRPIEDAQAVIWDRMAIDPTGRDARHCFVEDRLPRKEFQRKWPGIDPWHLNERFSAILRAGRWFDDQAVRVVEHWRMIQRNRIFALFPDGSVHIFEHDNYEDLIQKHGKPVKTRVAPCTYAQMHLCTGFAILSGPYEYQLNRLPIIRMSGRVVTIQHRRVRFGMIRFMKDPARLRNFWRSVAAEQLGYAPKAQWMAPESAVTGREDQFRKAHLTRDPLMIYNDGAEAPPIRLEPPTPQMALLNEATINTQDLKDVTGIQDASLGNVSNETSGTAILNRQREGDVANITYHDNGNAAILEAGDVINQLIPQIYDGTRIVRLIGKDESVRLQRINDPMDPKSPDLAIGSYDVALQTGPSYTTRRVEAAQAMMEAVQVWPELMTIAGDLVAKAQNWPGAEELSDRISRTIPPQFLSPEEQQKMQAKGGQAQPPIDPQVLQQMQQQMQQLAMRNQELEIKHDVHMKSLAIDAYKAETDRMRTSGDLALKGSGQRGEQMLQGIVTQQKDDHLYQQHAHDLSMEAVRQAGQQNLAHTQASLAPKPASPAVKPAKGD